VGAVTPRAELGAAAPPKTAGAEDDADAIVTLEDVPVAAGRLLKGSDAHAA